MTQSRICKYCGHTFEKRANEGPGTWNLPRRLYCCRQCANLDKTGKEKPGKRKDRLQRPNAPVTLPSGSIIHWDEYHRTAVGVRKVPVTCGRCRRKRSILDGNARKPYLTGYCYTCNQAHLRENMPSGARHRDWKGGHFISSNGYPAINIRALEGRAREIALQMARAIHGKPAVIHEHRLVMALHLDRPLLREEIVHHKNGVKTDNRIENLELTNQSEHQKMDRKYYDMWKHATTRIAELETELLRCREGRGE